MEFYRHIPVYIVASSVQRHLVIPRLTELCASISRLVSHQDSRGVIETPWGIRHVHRELVQRGVRFSFSDDACAMQWTVTADDASQQLQIHCSINCPQCTPQQKASLDQFLDDWKDGLVRLHSELQAQKQPACVDCGDSFGGFG